MNFGGFQKVLATTCQLIMA